MILDERLVLAGHSGSDPDHVTLPVNDTVRLYQSVYGALYRLEVIYS